ncbi:hypothetical protein AB0F09_07050 [Streptomyces olivaceus]|uniref:hypothetical protein n=1 Tax=Streptomyces olivaceus TaxID=47716 RepID=UPI0033FE8B37
MGDLSCYGALGKGGAGDVRIGVKLAVLVVVLGLGYVKRDDEKAQKPLFGLVGPLTVVNIFIAVLWT